MSSGQRDTHSAHETPWWRRAVFGVLCAGLLAVAAQADAQAVPAEDTAREADSTDGDSTEADPTEADSATVAGTDAGSRPDEADADGSADEPVLPFLPTEPATYPIPYSQRPLNLPRLNARAGGGLRVYHYADAISAVTNQDTSISLSLGGSFAVTDWLEFGVLDERIGMRHPVIAGGDDRVVPRGDIPQGLITLALTPDREYGDIPVHARVRVVADPSFDVSIDVGVLIPVSGDLALFGATVVRGRLSERFSIDSGLEVALRFDRDDNDPHLDLFLPFSALIQLHPAVFLAARTGVRWVDFDDLAFPLGFEFGYTIANDVRPLMDITLGFGFPALVTPNNPDKAQEDVWQVTIAGYAYFAL